MEHASCSAASPSQRYARCVTWSVTGGRDSSCSHTTPSTSTQPVHAVGQENGSVRLMGYPTISAAGTSRVHDSSPHDTDLALTD